MNICEFDECTGCGVCVDICNKDAVEMIKDKHGFLRPIINVDKCISCGACQKKCPANCTVDKSSEPKEIYYAWNKNKRTKELSTSGGVFPVFAKKIIDEGGAVAGVKWNNSFQTEYELIQSIDKLHTLYGSKYVQSHTNSIYSKVKQCLENGRKVLFAGTPCQNHALKSYLGKDYAGFFTIDLVCHGVPSEDVLKRYLLERSKGNLTNIKQIRLRHKRPYWDLCYVTIDFKKGTQYSVHTINDSYFNLFNVGYSLRKSCTQCKYTNIKRCGDITLADFWGFRARNFKSSQFLKGVSLVMINSKKGKELFERINNELIFGPATKDEALLSNKSLKEPYCLPSERLDAFWKDFENGMSVDNLQEKYTKNVFTIPRMLKLRRLYQQYGWIIKKK